jgi:malonyl-CoA decarboxylase
VSFGHFLIKQVVEEISREIPRLSTFVTLSPAPNFAAWLSNERSREGSLVVSAEDRAVLAALDRDDWWRTAQDAEAIFDPLMRAAAWYFVHGRNSRGTPLDSVARFHLGNGARLERLNWLGDLSARALRQSHGLMVNYLYDIADIEHNHEVYAQQQKVVASSAVTKLLRAPARDVVPLMAG